MLRDESPPMMRKTLTIYIRKDADKLPQLVRENAMKLESANHIYDFADKHDSEVPEDYSKYARATFQQLEHIRYDGTTRMRLNMISIT